jgi:hypothetical protein
VPKAIDKYNAQRNLTAKASSSSSRQGERHEKVRSEAVQSRTMLEAVDKSLLQAPAKAKVIIKRFASLRGSARTVPEAVDKSLLQAPAKAKGMMKRFASLRGSAIRRIQCPRLWTSPGHPTQLTVAK